MLGWKIFEHSVMLVLRNWREALRIFLVPALVAVAVIAGVGASIGLSFATLSDPEQMSGVVAEGGFFLALAIMWITLPTCALWATVSWHRFVLLEQYPQGWVPPFELNRILAYFGRGLLLLGVMFACMLPVVLILATAGQAAGALFFVVGVPLMFALIVLVYRLSLILPAAAIGRSLSLKESLDATKGAWGAIIVLLVVSGLVQVGLQAIITVMAALSPVLAELFALFIGVTMAVANISILTTFYGLYVEGRELG